MGARAHGFMCAIHSWNQSHPYLSTNSLEILTSLIDLNELSGGILNSDGLLRGLMKPLELLDISPVSCRDGEKTHTKHAVESCEADGIRKERGAGKEYAWRPDCPEGKTLIRG